MECHRIPFLSSGWRSPAPRTRTASPVLRIPSRIPLTRRILAVVHPAVAVAAGDPDPTTAFYIFCRQICI